MPSLLVELTVTEYVVPGAKPFSGRFNDAPWLVTDADPPPGLHETLKTDGELTWAVSVAEFSPTPLAASPVVNP